VGSRPLPGRLDPRPLGVLAAIVVLLAAAGVLPRWPGLLHLVALPPLDLVADLGLLLVAATGWPTFLAGAAVSLVVRSTVLALLLGGLTPARFLFALRFYLLLWPFSFLAAALLYGAAAVLFYGLFWMGLLAAVLVVSATAAAPWQQADALAAGSVASVVRGLGAAARRGLRLGTVGAYLAVLTLLGALADLAGPAAAVLLVPASAALTWLVAGALRTDPGRRWARRSLALLPAAGLAVAVVVAGTGPDGPPRAPAPDSARDGSLMLLSGVDSSSGSGAILEVDPHVMGWTCEHTHYYSYAGPGAGQPQNDALCPIGTGAPYGPEDTLRSRDELVPFLQEQLREAREPVVVAGHSQAAWLVWDAASSGRLPTGSTIVLVGAFPDHGVAYPAAGERAPGAAGRRLLQLMTDLPRPGGTTVFRPDSPLGREWLGHPDAVADTLSRPLPADVTALSVPSAFDLPLTRAPHRLPGAVDACPVPVIHPNLPYAHELQDAVVRVVEDRPQRPCSAWRQAPGPLLRHWSVPPS
jgi:hypothetical protein